MMVRLLIIDIAEMIQKKHKESMVLLTKFSSSFAEFDASVREEHGDLVNKWVQAGTASGKNADGTFFSEFKSKNPGMSYSDVINTSVTNDTSSIHVSKLCSGYGTESNHTREK